MKSLKNYLLAFLAVVAIGGSVLAWQEYQELIALRAQAMGADERARLQKAAWDAEKRAKQLQAQLLAQRGQPAGDGTDGAPADAQNRTLGNFAADWMARMDDPEIRRLMAIQQKAQISRQFAPLMKKLNLTPDQLSQFQSLMLEKRNVQLDVLSAASQQGINPMQNPDEFKKMIESAQSDLDQKIQTTLGDDNYAQFQNFQQTQGQRGVVNQLNQDLSYTDSPLTTAQRDQMVQIMAQTAPPKTPANAAAPNTPPPGGGNLVTDQTIALAQNVLSASQLQALQGIQQQQQANAQLQKLMMQSRAQAQGAAAAAPAPKGE